MKRLLQNHACSIGERITALELKRLQRDSESGWWYLKQSRWERFLRRYYVIACFLAG